MANAASSILGMTPGSLDTGAPRLDRDAIEARLPEFSDLTADEAAHEGAPASLDNLLDVTCVVTAELGRIKLSIADVLKFNTGSIVELDRLVSQPVDVLVQGVLVARGEVVVVNDRFGIRIQEIVDAKKRPQPSVLAR